MHLSANGCEARLALNGAVLSREEAQALITRVVGMSKADGIDVNAAALDEFKKQQAEVKPGKTEQSGTADTPEADPAS